MSYWPRLLHFSPALCWLVILATAIPSAIAIEDYPEDPQSSLRNNPSKSLEPFIPGSNTANQRLVTTEVVLSPHALPPDEIAAIFPHIRNSSFLTEGNETQSSSESENLASQPFSPTLPTATFSRHHQTALYNEESTAQSPQIEDERGTEPFSSQPFPPDTPKATFSQPASPREEKEDTVLAANTDTNNNVDNPSDGAETPAREDSSDVRYQVAPQAIPPEALPTSGTQFSFNGQWLNHRTESEVQSAYQLTDNLNNLPPWQGTVGMENLLQRSVTADQRVTVEHRGTYFQTAAVTQSREVTTTQVLPQTVAGFGIQLSMTGACPPQGNTITQDRCSYTPGISTLENADILDLQTAGRLQIDSELHEVVSNDSLAAIAQPGFQRGANGQTLGIDLFLPNTGARSGNQFSNGVAVNSDEVITRMPAFTLAQNRQIIQMNDREAVLGRTLRGNTWVPGGEDVLINTLLQAGISLLPDIIPQVEGTGQPANTRVNQNLFLAANNARLPNNSFTLYHGGIGRADSIEAGMHPPEMPSANFHGIWIGFSPVVTYRLNTQEIAEVIGPTRNVATAGAEGSNSQDGNLEFVSTINGNQFSAGNIDDTYVQIYQDLYETDSQTTFIENYTEETTYHPHISFTGNVTSFDSVFNYYAGALVGNNLNMYAGLDYTAFRPNGLTYNLGSIFYTNPSRDRYSQLNGKLTQRFQLSPQTSIALSGGMNWGLDSSNQIDNFTVNNRSSSVYLQANAQVGSFSLGATGTIDGILPNSARDSIRLEAAIKLTDTLALSGFMTPFSRDSSYARYGAALSWRLSGEGSPSLQLGWNNQYSSYGIDPFGNELESSEDTFSLAVQF